MAVRPWKAAYEAKLWELLKEYGQILVVSADNVKANQLQNIRRDLHEDSVMVLGKNTLKRRSIKMDADSSGNKAFLNLPPLLVGNVGLIFTKADLRELSEVVAKYEVPAPEGLLFDEIKTVFDHEYMGPPSSFCRRIMKWNNCLVLLSAEDDFLDFGFLLEAYHTGSETP